MKLQWPAGHQWNGEKLSDRWWKGEKKPGDRCGEELSFDIVHGSICCRKILKPQNQKMKTYLALNVPIRGLPVAHRGNNGNSQCNVVVRAKTKKQVGEILGHDVRYLNTYSNLHDVTGKKWDAIGVPDGCAYYQPGCCKSGWINDWFPIPQPKA